MLPSSDLFVAHAARFLRVAAEEGVTILAGSDTGTGNAWLYPGDSLHRELDQLVAYGLSPLQALRGATIDAAQWLGVSQSFGTIEAAKAADLVILRDNPLEDIANTRSIEAVVQQGVYFDAKRLEQLRTLAGE
jgi:imidazolonepropionase-like amidohydrolase